MSDLKYWVWLSSLGGVRYRAKSLLIAHFGGVREAYFARRADYDRLDFLNADERAALENKSTDAANRALGVCAEKGIRVITMQDAAYPSRLNEIYDPPLVLYVDGKLPVVDDRCAVAVIGTRSAIFAPVRSLGLIIIDEDQEDTYKSENQPRYHARDVARFRCVKQNALLVLASATPSVETFYKAKSGRYSLHVLPSRYGEAQLPAVEVVDMRQELEGEGGGIVSARLRQEITRTLEKGRQAILLLNRRGFNTFVSCRSCGHVVTCPSCSISLTYHRANGRLMCHYCGHSQELVRTCPECGSDKVRYAGLGTQRAEEELERLFPGAPVLRMDTDTTMSRYAYEKKFREFSEGKYPLMVGTQMVAKGLDFPNVGLVGILSADQSLYGDDYRCFETTFALLTQVIGRAGRRDSAGKAVIQTYTPDNYVIELAARQDYEGFYEAEIAARRMMKYPPYTDLCMFGFVGTEEAGVKQAAYRFLALLRQEATGPFSDVPMIVLDPSPAMVSRVAGKYRYKLLVKTVNTARMRRMTAGLLERFHRAAENKAVTVYADINPAAML